VRRLALIVPLGMGVVCGTYTIIYLARWEWNRAIIAGLFFVAVEIVVCAMIVVDRLRRVEARLDALASSPPPGAPPEPFGLDAIQAAAPAPADRFGWIRDQAGQTNVFLPILLGAGVLASALAWVVEHVARATLSPLRERRLADSLGVLRPPAGLLADAPPPPPLRRPLRRALLGTAFVLGLVGSVVATAGAIDYVADRTQTRPDARRPGVETVIELELLGSIAAHDPARVLGHLWAECTGPDVFRLRTLPDPTIHQLDGRIRIHIGADVGDHGLARLRGCLNDTTLDRVQARVVRTELAAR
jgi:hypothetical protein